MLPVLVIQQLSLEIERVIDSGEAELDKVVLYLQLAEFVKDGMKLLTPRAVLPRLMVSNSRLTFSLPRATL